jgi:hypothetical protein
MGNAPKTDYERITRASIAWETLRPKKIFGGMTLEKFTTLIAPSLAARATIARLENELTAAHSQRDDADRVSLDALQLVVNSIKGDAEEGEDGELYEAMGYVRKSERKSGLHRTSKTDTAPTT